MLAAGGCRDAGGDDAAHWTRCRQAGIWLVQASDGRILRPLAAGFPGTPRSLAFVSDGQALLAVGCATIQSGDCTGLVVETWRADGGGGGPVRRTAIAAGGPLSAMALSPGGRLVATASGLAIRLWDSASGHAVGAPLLGHERRGIDGLAFSPDGKTLASSTLDDVILWDVASGRPRGRPQPGSAVAFRPDGLVVAVAPVPSGPPPRTIVLRGVATGQQTGEIAIGDDDVVLEMTFSPDGRTLAATIVAGGRGGGNRGGAFTLWDVARAERLGPPLAWPGGRFFALAFHPDGTTVATGAEDGRLVSWDVDPQSWRRQACRIANRNLAYDEWTRAIGEEPYRRTCAQWPADPRLVQAARRRASNGDLAGAVALFERARALDPALTLDPRQEAVKSSVEELLANGRYLAAAGDIDKATAAFEHAHTLDRALPFDDAAREAKRLAAPGIAANAARLARDGAIAEAVAELARARAYDAKLAVPAATWIALCWHGALAGQAAAVAVACDSAMAGDFPDGRAMTARAVAKAMLGRLDEAAADVRAFLDWEKHEQAKRMGLQRRQHLAAERARHEQWLAALGAGKNPFTAEERKRMRDEEAFE